MKIQINGHSFDVDEPYVEGAPLGAAEAAELNRLRATRLRYRLQRRMAQGLMDSWSLGKWFTQEKKDFTFASLVPRPLYGSVEYEIDLYTRQRVMNEANAKGVLLQEDEVVEACRELLASGEGAAIRSHCRDIFEIRKRSAEAPLESLL